MESQNRSSPSTALKHATFTDTIRHSFSSPREQRKKGKDFLQVGKYVRPCDRVLTLFALLHGAQKLGDRLGSGAYSVVYKARVYALERAYTNILLSSICKRALVCVCVSISSRSRE